MEQLNGEDKIFGFIQDIVIALIVTIFLYPIITHKWKNKVLQNSVIVSNLIRYPIMVVILIFLGCSIDILRR
jgi:hypothetical protein